MKWEHFHNLYGHDIQEASEKYELDAAILGGLIMQESAGNPSAKSHCGAYGLTQVMPATAREKGYDLSTPRNQIFAGADYLAWLNKYFAHGDITKMLAGYNAGPGRIKNDVWMRFAETRKYVPRVLKLADEYRRYLLSLKKEKIDEKKRKPIWRHCAWLVNKLRRRDYA